MIVHSAVNATNNTNDQSILWGHPLGYWDGIGVKFMFAGAALGFLALTVSLVSSFVLWRVAGAAQDVLDMRVAEANKAGIEAGEKAGHAQTDVDAANLEIARQKTLTAEAQQSAATADEHAAQARLQTELVKKSVAWRTLSPDEIPKMKTVIFAKGGTVNLRYVDGDPEGLYFATRFAEVFKSSNWRVGPGAARSNNDPVFDIWLIGPESEDKEIVRAAMKAANITAQENNPPPLMGGFAITSYSGAPTLLVGSRRPAVFAP
jgi:hypothetical protein